MLYRMANRTHFSFPIFHPTFLFLTVWDLFCIVFHHFWLSFVTCWKWSNAPAGSNHQMQATFVSKPDATACATLNANNQTPSRSEVTISHPWIPDRKIMKVTFPDDVNRTGSARDRTNRTQSNAIEQLKFNCRMNPLFYAERRKEGLRHPTRTT